MIAHRFLDSFAELCACRNDVQLEGLYSGRWYRVAVAGVDGAGAHLLYVDTDETELLRPADFEPRSWRVRGGAPAGGGGRSIATAMRYHQGFGTVTASALVCSPRWSGSVQWPAGETPLRAA